MVNCITEAFDLGNYPGSSGDFYLYPHYSKSILEQINTLMAQHSRKARKVNPSETLKEGEWLVALWGPFPTKFDYEHMPEIYDYHFAFQKDGQWFHRDGKNQPVTKVDLKELSKDFEPLNVTPQYFAVRRVEE